MGKNLRQAYENHRKTKRKPWEKNWKTRGKNIGNLRKTMWKLYESHKKITAKRMKNHQKTIKKSKEKMMRYVKKFKPFLIFVETRDSLTYTRNVRPWPDFGDFVSLVRTVYTSVYWYMYKHGLQSGADTLFKLWSLVGIFGFYKDVSDICGNHTSRLQKQPKFMTECCQKSTTIWPNSNQTHPKHKCYKKQDNH